MKIFVTICLFLLVHSGYAQDSALYTRTELIYGRKDGMALTMIRLTPINNARHKAIISLISGNWISNYNMSTSYIQRALPLVKNGFTVFMVFHGSQPRYNIQDEIQDIKKAIRYVRYAAKENNIDPDHIGITGASSGGHLSLMASLSDDKPGTGKEPADLISSKVQAVAVFYPPTDFINWGEQNAKIDQRKLALAGVAPAFDFKKLNDSTRLFDRVTAEEQKEIAKQISPVNHVSSDDPPVLIIHGDADPVVPLQQSKSIIEKLKAAGVINNLIIKPGGGHGWRDMDPEQQIFADWFIKYLGK